MRSLRILPVLRASTPSRGYGLFQLDSQVSGRSAVGASGANVRVRIKPVVNTKRVAAQDMTSWRSKHRLNWKTSRRSIRGEVDVSSQDQAQNNTQMEVTINTIFTSYGHVPDFSVNLLPQEAEGL